MRIHAFVEHYPIPYKPYYDTHFADLLRKGHDLTIFATGRMDRTVNEKVEQFGLCERTRYFPLTLRTLPAHLLEIAGGAASLGRRAPGRVRAALAATRGRARVTAAARALALGSGRPDLSIVHSLGAAAMLPWLRDAYPGTPVALYYHGGEVPMVRPMEDDVAARAFASADIVFTNTEASRTQAIQRGCPPERVAVLPVGFALEDYVPHPGRAYRQHGSLRLVSAGRVSEEKGLIYALQAVRQLVAQGERAISYTIVGDGYQRPQLEAYVRENGLEPHVRFAGLMAHDALLRELGQADALLLPSIPLGNWVETQACAVQEAMLMGALVITSRIGGVPESIPPQMQRFVVPPADSAALADAIRRLAALPAAALRAEAEACRRFVVERYDVSRLDDALLETTLRAHGSGRPHAPSFAPIRSQKLGPVAAEG